MTAATPIRRGRSGALALTGALALAALWPVPVSSAEAGPRLSVIVRAGDPTGARRAVEAAGGTVTMSLPIIDGVAAEVPSHRLLDLASAEGVVAVAPNAEIGFTGAKSTKKCSEFRKRKKRKKCRQRKKLAGILAQRVVRADKLWAKGVTGDGVTVAILDTGVYEHPDLAGRILHCEDLSNEFAEVDVVPTPTPSATLPLPDPSLSVTPLPEPTSNVPPLPRTKQSPAPEAGCTDTFGHGTFMAGLVAGDGSSSNRRFSGVAPEADVVAIKAAGFDGSTDVSKILAGIQWAVAHKDAYGIRVLNLSLGTDSAQDYRLSPLNYAVERAWNAGIVVVVSSGNSGPDESTVMKPGDDPFVITVGSSNDEGTLKISDDRVPVFSSRGNTRVNDLAKPDVLAPGVHSVSLRSPGSAIDQQFEHARVRGAYFRGTGTSMSTATVSGIVALMLGADPSLTPNQVKFRLLETARAIVDVNPKLAGRGLVNAYAATRRQLVGEANQGLEPSVGLGSIEADRGTIEVDVMTPAGQLALAGEFVAMTPDPIDPLNPGALVPWVSAAYTVPDWNQAMWEASTWKTEDWSASTWKASTWKNTEWDASTWKGTEWTNPDWDASTWRNVDWDASTWKASTWKSHWYATAWD